MGEFREKKSQKPAIRKKKKIHLNKGNAKPN